MEAIVDLTPAAHKHSTRGPWTVALVSAADNNSSSFQLSDGTTSGTSLSITSITTTLTVKTAAAGIAWNVLPGEASFAVRITDANMATDDATFVIKSAC